MKFNNNLSVESQPWAKRITMDIDSLLKRVSAQGTIVETNTKYLSGIGNTTELLSHRVEQVENQAADRNNLFAEHDAALAENEARLDELYNETLPDLEDELAQAASDVAAAMQAAQEALGDLVDVNAELDAMEQALSDVQGDLVDVQDVVDTANQNAQDALDAATAAETTASGANARMSGTGANGPATRTNGAALIQGDEYVRVNSSGQAIGVQVWNGTSWVPQQMLADSVLVPGSAGSTVIADGAITTDKIVANAITGDKVAANSITASRLVIGDGDNFIVDPYLLRQDLLDYRIAESAGSWTPLTSTQIPGATYVYAPPSSNIQAFRLITPEVDGSYSFPPVVAGRKYNIRFRVNGGGTGSPGVGVDEIRVAVRERKADGSTTYLAVGDWIKVPSNVFTWVDYQWEVPSDTVGAQFDLQVNVGNVGNVSFATPIVTAMTGTTLIEDGAITTDKITASAITGDKVAANTLTADKLVIGNGSNVIPNGGLTHGNFFTTSTGWDYVPDGRGAGRGVIRYTIQGSSRRTPHFPITPGMQYRFSVDAKSSVAGSVFFVQLVHGGTSANPYMVSSRTLTTSWQTFTHIFNAPDDMTSVQMVLYGNHSNGVQGGTQDFSNFKLQAMTGATLIENGAVTTDKIAANAVTAGKVAAQSVAGAVGSFLELNANQLTTGTLNANRIASNTINADKLASNSVLARHLNVTSSNSSTSRTMTFDSSGLKIFVDDGSEPAISLGVDSTEYFSITDNSGNTTVSMSPDGTIVAGGFELSGGMSWRGENMEDVINAMPRGVVSGGGRALTGTIPGGGRIGFGQLTFTPETGRTYKLTTHGPSLNPAAGGYFDLQTRWASGSSPLHTATVDQICRVFGGPGWSTPSIQRYFKAGDTIAGATLTPGVPVTIRFDILAVLQNVAISSGQPYFRAYIEDVGMASQYTFNENWAGLSDQINYPGENDNTPTPPAPKQTVTKTYTATAAESYRGNNAKATGYVWQGKVSQGQYSTVSGGALKGLWVFPNMTSDLSGATISKVELYVENQHTYANAGATAYFHTHGHTSIPTTYSGTSSNTFTSSFSRGQGKWITLNTTTYGNGLKSGAIRGFGIYTTGTANYAYFSPTARIRITYTK